jgi:hypothetical protein
MAASRCAPVWYSSRLMTTTVATGNGYLAISASPPVGGAPAVGRRAVSSLARFTAAEALE